MAETSSTHHIAERAEQILRTCGAEAAHQFILCTLRHPATRTIQDGRKA